MRSTNINAWRCQVTLAILLIAAPAAASRPVPISPAHYSLERSQTIADTCPTFSWTPVGRADAYILTVYDRSAEGGAPLRVLERKLPARSTSWTPGLDECLRAGRGYAWTIGALMRGGEIVWSDIAMIDIVGVPTESEFRRAWETVRRYLEAHDAGLEKSQPSAVNESRTINERPSDSSATDWPPSARTRDGGTPESLTPLAGTAFELHGNLHAVTADTPTLRLEQDGSGTFGPALWDITANETAFNLTEGDARVPFVVQTGAPTGSLFVGSTGNVGIGTLAPSSRLEVGGSLSATTLAGNGSFLTNVTAAGLSCSNCLGSGHIDSGAVGTSELGLGVVSYPKLDTIFGIRVECNGECDDATLGDICSADSANPASSPIAVACSDLAGSATPNACGGDNVCTNRVFIYDGAGLGFFCEDVSGHDAIVYCMYD